MKKAIRIMVPPVLLILAITSLFHSIRANRQSEKITTIIETLELNNEMDSIQNQEISYLLNELLTPNN